jgi:hypothetical protein
MSSYKQKRPLLSPEKLRQAVREVASLTAKLPEKPVLIGGLAMQMYGSDRLTGDIDFASTRPLPPILPRGKSLSFGGTQTTAPNGVPIDWVVRDDDFAGLYESAIDHAQRVAGVPVLVATPEYLVAMKLVAGRRRDVDDIEHLVLSEAVNVTVARRVIREMLGAYAAREFDGLVEEMRWRASRGDK